MESLILALVTSCVVAVVTTGCEKNLSVSDADRDVVLRAADLIPFGYGLEKTEPYETFKRIEYFDGSHELTYEYETPDSETENALYLNVTISIENSIADAVTSHGAGVVGLNIGLKANGVKTREIKDFYSYGERALSSCSRWMGNRLAMSFSVREGKRVFLMILSGMYFEDPATFKELIEGRLRKFSMYTPT